MSAASDPRRVGYLFGPLERRGLLGDVAAGRVAVLVLGALAAVALLDRAPSAGGALGAVTVCALAAAATYAPLAGRTLDQWLPVVVTFAGRRLGSSHRFRSPGPGRGRAVELLGTRLPRWRTAEPAPPEQVRGVRILAATHRDRSLGALSERGGRRLTAVLACRVGAFTLLDPGAQERRLARWGLVLAGAGGSAIRRLQWIERTAPAQGDELARWMHAERDPSVPRGAAMLESYLELISTSTRVAQEHEVLIAVQVDAARIRDRGRGAVVRALIESTERVAQGIEAAEVTVLGALGPAQIARTLRTAYDPYARGELTALEAADPERAGPEEDGAWPLAARERWDHYEADGALHATYWISGWPRVEVSPVFMDSLLGHSGVVRTVAVTFEPIAIERSTREVEAAVTRDQADRELRARFGQSETARQRQAGEATRRREAELAAGHGEVRLSGFVTVSGRDPDELRQACADVLEQGARARLELRRLYGQQADAFTFTLPLCRGLR
ncbi:MAG TPA: SCO6880 family protein [Solirubrobacteraceae bacterium]|nr:SCO6880 family protein [Solirubrobacteraceae bacterium]